MLAHGASGTVVGEWVSGGVWLCAGGWVLGEADTGVCRVCGPGGGWCVVRALWRGLVDDGGAAGFGDVGTGGGDAVAGGLGELDGDWFEFEVGADGGEPCPKERG